MGSQHQHLVLQVVLFAGLHIPPLIQIAAIHAGKIGSVIDNDCTLTFEKFVHIKVCLHIDRIASVSYTHLDVYKRQGSGYQGILAILKDASKMRCCAAAHIGGYGELLEDFEIGRAHV